MRGPVGASRAPPGHAEFVLMLATWVGIVVGVDGKVLSAFEIGGVRVQCRPITSRRILRWQAF